MSKVLIDIPEHNLNVIKRFVGGDGFEELPPRIIEDLIRSAYLGIALDGLTNGEIMQKMFPNMEVEADELFIEVRYLDSNNSNDIMQFYPDWWNSKWGEET